MQVYLFFTWVHMKSLFAKTDNFFIMFFIMLSCFWVLSCWLAVFFVFFLLNKKNQFLQINSSYNVNEIKGHLSDLKRDIFITVS